ncbi:MAG TPA: BolA family transcriptional regulator [Gammaproteobacteria bacterium]|nr:BolA family transcriptional regulator [Gammaproteobacteria bacterium]
MSNQASIEQKLQSALAPVHLEVVNESHMHNVPPGSESHFKVVVVSAAFDGKMLVARHRMVNEILAEDLQRIHALALHTYTPEEWAERGQAPQSPPCQGGGKQQ